MLEPNTFIQLDKEKKAVLARLFGVTPQFVGLALRFKRNSKKAMRLRGFALHLGGELMNLVKDTTLFSRREGLLVWRAPDGEEVIVSQPDRMMYVRKDGKMVDKQSIILPGDIGRLRDEVENVDRQAQTETQRENQSAHLI